MDEQIFMSYSGLLAYDKRDNLDYFEDVAFNPLNIGFDFLSSLYVFVSIIAL